MDVETDSPCILLDITRLGATAQQKIWLTKLRYTCCCLHNVSLSRESSIIMLMSLPKWFAFGRLSPDASANILSKWWPKKGRKKMTIKQNMEEKRKDERLTATASLCLFVSVSSSLRLFVYLSVCLSVCLSVYMSIRMSVSPSVYLSFKSNKTCGVKLPT